MNRISNKIKSLAAAALVFGATQGAFAQAQDVAVLTYNNKGIVCQRPEDPWALKECFTCKLPMTGVDSG